MWTVTKVLAVEVLPPCGASFARSLLEV